MTGTDLVQRTQQTVALIDHPQFLEQVEALLPEDVPLRRFVQVAKTAIRSNPDLVEADQNTLFAAIIRCAQDGLYPDKHEAVLNVYSGKVTYLPMVHGVIRAARDYGWLMHAEAVYENDQFEWRGSDEKPHHRHPRPGEDRGDLVAAFAYATHGAETMSVVLYQDDIAKRRAKAQTDKVWKEWPEAMYRKSAAHALYRKLPAANAIASTASTRPSSSSRPPRPSSSTAPTGRPSPLVRSPPRRTIRPSPQPYPLDEGPGTGGEPQQAEPASPPSPAGSAPGDDDEPAPPWAAAAAVEIPAGQWKGKTLADVAAIEAGREWLAWALKNEGRFNEPFYTALTGYVEGALPELWAEHTERQAA
jgi:phage RecT family recombinase